MTSDNPYGEFETAWCPGCGNFAIRKAMVAALTELGLPPRKVVFSTGIGQAAKAPHYIRVNLINGLHGRSLPAATGVKLANPGLRFRPGMYANVTLYGGASGQSVLVPTESVIATGKRSLIILAEGEGRFRPVLVKTGIENDGKTEILSGVKAGDAVVVSGQFLIESEANLKGVLARLSANPAGQGQTWAARGEVTAVDAAAGDLEMKHEPIPAIEWPAMTMPFDVADKAMLNGLKVGQKVDFDLAKRDDGYVVVAIRPREVQP